MLNNVKPCNNVRIINDPNFKEMNIECLKPKCTPSNASTACAYPWYRKSLEILEEDSNEVKKWKEEVLNKIQEYWLNMKSGRANAHVHYMETMIGMLVSARCGLIQQARRNVEIKLNNEKATIGADCYLKTKEGGTAVFIEFKGNFLDTNSIRSAILNGLLLKEGLKNDMKVLFYYVGTYWDDIDKIAEQDEKGKVKVPLMKWAKAKGHVDDFIGIGKIQKLIDQINSKTS